MLWPNLKIVTTDVQIIRMRMVVVATQRLSSSAAETFSEFVAKYLGEVTFDCCRAANATYAYDEGESRCGQIRQKCRPCEIRLD